ncbi:MAG TPA: D-glycero-beta-D-manno-heptose-7-phosphate kinase [Steroidobacteraceae bacterium]
MNFESLLRALNEFHTARVLVVGDVMLDRFIYGSVERISPEAPIPVVNVERTSDMPGGAANVARNIAAMGARVKLLGVVGADEWARDLRTQLAASPSIEAHLVTDATRPTSVKTRYVADSQQVMRADRESRTAVGVEIERALLDQFAVALRDTAVVILSDYAKGVLSDSLTKALINTARRAGKTVLVDPKSRDLGKYRGANVLTPNRQELQQASGFECRDEASVHQGGQAILRDGVCDALVVTRGKDGMSVIDGDGATHLPTSARQVFDVSGAGDTAVAAIALGTACGATLIESAQLGNIAAGLVVGKRGTATVSAGEMVAELAAYSGNTDREKIYTLETALHLTRIWRASSQKVAFANGCFDLLHPGHISLLEQARASADRLIVGLNADVSIRLLKGPNRPVQGEVARATVLAALKFVDAVVIFSEETPLRLIEALEPDVLVKGSDYTLDNVVGAREVMARGGRVVLIDLLKGHSTSETVKRVATIR